MKQSLWYKRDMRDSKVKEGTEMNEEDKNLKNMKIRDVKNSRSEEL